MMTWKYDRLYTACNQLLCCGRAHHVHRHRACDGGDGSSLPVQALDRLCAGARGTLMVQHYVGHIDEFFPRRMIRWSSLTMLTRNQRDHLHIASLRSHRHFDNQLADAARGDHDKGVMRTKFETLQDLFR